MIDLATVGATAGVTGTINVLLWVVVQRAIGRRDKYVDGLGERLQHLEEKRITGLEERLDGAAKSRKDLHESLTMVRETMATIRGEVRAGVESNNTRLDGLVKSVDRLRNDFDKVVLDSREATRAVSRLEGRVEQLTRGGGA